MHKTGRPWYRRAKDSWYVWHEGQQVFLAKGKENKAAAFARFAEILGAEPVHASPAVATVGELVERYKVHLKDRIKPTTLASYDSVLKPLVDELGNRPAGDMAAADLETWARRQSWSPTTQRFALTVAGGAFRWAERSGLLPANPIRELHKPPGRSRGSEILIDKSLHEELLGVVSPEFRDFLETVHATGARPGEIARIEARNIVWEAGCAVLLEHKTDKTGRVRTIYLPSHTLALCRALVVNHPTGPIFRNTRGEVWLDFDSEACFLTLNPPFSRGICVFRFFAA
jgi:integrase